MSIYIIILSIIIIALLFMYINTYKKLKVIQNENEQIKRVVQNEDEQIKKAVQSGKKENNEDIDKSDEVLNRIYMSNRKIAFYSGVLSEKLEKYSEKDYSDVIKREAYNINKNLKIFKNRNIL